MSKGFRSLTISVVAVLALFGVQAGVAAAGSPIRPDQHFAGLVNGTNRNVVVDTVCAGPIWPGRMGPVAGGQTMAVTQVNLGHGYTGPFSQVYSRFLPAPTTSTTTPTQLKFTTYDTPQQIPAGVEVPCDGKGRVEFSPCPYLAPCAAGFVPDYVEVTFVNIAR